MVLILGKMYVRFHPNGASPIKISRLITIGGTCTKQRSDEYQSGKKGKKLLRHYRNVFKKQTFKYTQNINTHIEKIRIEIVNIFFVALKFVFFLNTIKKSTKKY